VATSLAHKVTVAPFLNLSSRLSPPAIRIAYNISDKWAVSAEEYADYGPLHSLNGGSDQSHMLYGVVNHAMKAFEFEAGIGVGLTSASDKVTLKLLIIKDLN